MIPGTHALVGMDVLFVSMDWPKGDNMEEVYEEMDEVGSGANRILTWAGMGTPRQFYLEVVSKIDGTNYEAELEDRVITCYRVEKEGGFLGIGGETVREPVLKVVFPEGEEPEIPEEPRDEEFIELLAGELTQH